MKHILLIEPDRVLAETYKRALESENYTVTPVNGAQAGIIATDEHLPDGVILELQLVGHSGIEFLYELRSYPDWQDIPVIIHSHVPPLEFAGSGPIMTEQLGVSAYLYKPHTTLERLLRELKESMAVRA
jgi:CheY-like chemotaxis protein